MFDDIAQGITDQQIFVDAPIQLTIRRLDQIHPQISGNKFFKLKYNFLAAQQQGKTSLITFGGAFSNHIAATAYAANRFGFQSIGIIRGEELATQPLNHTLATAQKLGMQLHFVSRKDYRLKDSAAYLNALETQYPNSYIIPEGGTNAFAIQGCTEILSADDLNTYDVICCAVGTGGTITGLIEASTAQQQILGFSALKGDFLSTDVAQMTEKRNWKILDHYCCGGYAKTTIELLQFIENFQKKYQIPLEPIYTGKMLLGIFDLISQHYFAKNSRILVIHSGGLQGRSL
ncbi:MULTISPECIES: 1-aminocyclopropane-1-carboxylate deaminase/D-cysteine desulfhydrase [Acinetobacter]|uniref:Pyridoxal-phosphate dependent enzyme n=1 Tax=Acinetobacter piscicola TaxID=2006115 RepID=A0A7S6VUL5_9GAMM|nr:MULTISPECIES: pyridoxal-phosphate dependent enzyme [Acinetobacter]QOW45228.1 pyridoxal-phosphate dependent enzyme [Acinetobacter piscicola]